MKRVVLVCVAFAAAACAQSDRQLALQSTLGGMNSRLNNGQPSGQQVIADSNRLAAGFNGLAPSVAGFSQDDYQHNRELARDAFAWLARARMMYAADPAVSQSLMNTYGVIGDFYHNYGTFYPAGAMMGYSCSNSLARGLVLDPRHGRSFERDLERTAMSWAALGYLQQAACPPGRPPSDEIAPPPSPDEIPATPLPQVDESKLNDEQKAQWADARDRFMTVAPKVQVARQLLAQLAARLAQQGPNITVHPQDAAAALMMQGFLDDAANLISTGQFAKASEALNRADYMRRKLSSVTGQ